MKSLIAILVGASACSALNVDHTDVYAQLADRSCKELVTDAQKWMDAGNYLFARTYLEVAESRNPDDSNEECDPVRTYASLLYEEADSEEKTAGRRDVYFNVGMEGRYARAWEKLAQSKKGDKILQARIEQKMKMLRMQSMQNVGTRSLGLILE